MGLNYPDIWNKVLDIIKTELNPVSFNTWFDKDTCIYKIDDETITLKVPMPIYKNVLETNYHNLLSNAFLEVIGEDRKLECILESDINEKVDDLVEKVVNNVEVINKEDDIPFESNIKKDMNFGNFVEGTTNKFAKTAALAVAENPGVQWNPLFIYGKSGIGKTHLMHAIGNYINENKPDLKVLYTTSDDFRKDYVGISGSDNSFTYADEFKNKYRNIDVLIIDDIQLILESKKTKEEFFHTFNYLHDKNKQIIISSDRSPEDLKILEDRLKNRFASGLPVDIYPPDYELRCKIIKDKIKYLPYVADKMTDEAIEFIANSCESDVRTLVGAINRVAALAAIYVPEKVDLEFANQALKDYIKSNPYVSNDITSIQKAVADYYNITVEVLKGKRRSSNIAYPRMIAMYLSRMLTDESFPRIGLEFGGRNHSTVIHAINTIENDLKENSQLNDIINEIKSNL